MMNEQQMNQKINELERQCDVLEIRLQIYIDEISEEVTECLRYED